MATDRYGAPWSESELVLALNLYCQLPFRLTKASTPSVITLANQLGRTPSSLARKLGNFGAFDPTLAAAGISGLIHFSKADQEIWNKYSVDWGMLADDAALLIDDKIEALSLSVDVSIKSPTGPSEIESLVRIRRHQAFFRRAVLSSYESSCCVCALEIPDLLTASHIVPWSFDETLRSDPSNGLCLCSGHDRAFDRGYMCLTYEGLIRVSPLLSAFKSRSSREQILAFDGQPWIRPSRFKPKETHLKWHEEHVFRIS